MKTIFKRISEADAAFYKRWGFFPAAGGAVENKYVDAAIVAGKLGSSLTQAASGLYMGVATFEVAAADDNGSIYRIFKSVDPNLIPVSLRLSCDAIDSATDYDCGLYDTLENGGAEVDKDIFADGINIAAGFSRILGLDLLVAVDLANAKKRMWELVSGLTLNNKKGGYDIALTANTVGTAAGTITVVGIFAS